MGRIFLAGLCSNRPDHHKCPSSSTRTEGFDFLNLVQRLRQGLSPDLVSKGCVSEEFFHFRSRIECCPAVKNVFSLMIQVILPKRAGPVDEADDDRCSGFHNSMGLIQHALGIIHKADCGDEKAIVENRILKRQDLRYPLDA